MSDCLCLFNKTEGWITRKKERERKQNGKGDETGDGKRDFWLTRC